MALVSWVGAIGKIVQNRSMEKIGMLKLDIYIALVCFLFPLGWSVSGFQPNIVVACLCWGFTLLLSIHALWVYKRTARWTWPLKSSISLLFVVAVVWLAWSPVIAEYRREYFIVDGGKFVSVLKSQSSNRALIRIGCPLSAQDSCVHAGHFLDLFREAGWRVEGNSVQIVQIGKPEAGLLIFLHGTGAQNPDDPKSGLWVLQSESVRTVTRTLKASASPWVNEQIGASLKMLLPSTSGIAR